MLHGRHRHNPVTSLQHPDWTPVFDYDPRQPTSRARPFWTSRHDQIMVMGYHFPFPLLDMSSDTTRQPWEAAQWVW